MGLGFIHIIYYSLMLSQGFKKNIMSTETKIKHKSQIFNILKCTVKETKERTDINSGHIENQQDKHCCLPLLRQKYV